LQRRRAGPRLGYAASKWCVMRMKRQQVEPGTLKRVMKYLGKREPSPPSIDHTQPMETIGGSESEDTTYLSALLPRIEQLPPGIVVEETEMGRATDHMVRFLAGEFGVSQSAITVVFGRFNVNKQLRVTAPTTLPSVFQQALPF